MRGHGPSHRAEQVGEQDHSEPERFRRQQASATLFLRAERRPDGSRNYKLAVQDPLPTSFGEDLYYRLGGWLDEDKAVTPVTPVTPEASPDGEPDPDSQIPQASTGAASPPDAPHVG